MVRDHLKLEVVRLYYLENLSQNQIAKQMEISRSYVSKLLIEARKEKLIEIRSSNPWLIETDEEKYLRKKYGLKKGFIVSAGRKKDEGKREAYYQELGRVLNDILNAIVKDGDTIGVAWGRTIYECSKRLSTEQEYKDIKGSSVMRWIESEPEQHIFRGNQQEFCLCIWGRCICHDSSCHCGKQSV